MDLVIHTYGCKVNSYDSGLLNDRLNNHYSAYASDHARGQTNDQANDQTSNHTNDPSHGGNDPQQQSAHSTSVARSPRRVHVLNTCAVTAEATRQAVRQARRLKAQDPFCLVVVTGCGAQVDTEHFSALSGVDLVVANSHKSQLHEIIRGFERSTNKQKVFKSNIFQKMELEEGGGRIQERTRAFLKIQDGCNSFCTFCVIPFARGKSRSLPLAHLVDRVRQLVDQGIQEVVLTGVHIGDYTDDYSDTNAQGIMNFTDLVESILGDTKVSRLRLSSLEPHELTEPLLQLYESQPRLCPHIHLSIQSFHNEILRAMKRTYGAAAIEDVLWQIRERLPHAFVGMDVIAGFPGETSEIFSDTLMRYRSSPWTRMHVFPYSERPGTLAARMTGAVPIVERRRRAQVLRELSLERVQLLAAEQVGQEKHVLLLKNQRGLGGLCRDYWPMRLVSTLAESSGEIRAKVIGYEPRTSSQDVCLIGQVCV